MRTVNHYTRIVIAKLAVLTNLSPTGLVSGPCGLLTLSLSLSLRTALSLWAGIPAHWPLQTRPLHHMQL